MIDRGSIVVLVTHDSRLVENICTRAVYLSKGQVVADGKPQNVVSQYRQESLAF
jgi:ABC-type polysaccharide/polyol phosphate transport system ATPase subunit